MQPVCCNNMGKPCYGCRGRRGSQWARKFDRVRLNQFTRDTGDGVCDFVLLFELDPTTLVCLMTPHYM